MTRKNKSSKALQTTTSPPSSSRQFYDIPELRSRLFFFLSSHELAHFARVEKKGLNEVAKVLYHCVTYYKARTMGGTKATQRLYRNSVTEIDARGQYLCLTDGMLQKLDMEFELGRGRTARIDAYLANYRLDVFNAIIPPLLEKLSCLRKIKLGSSYQAFGKDSWVVNFLPKLGETDQGGTIDLITTYKSTPRSAPTGLILYPAPPNYPLRHRFDLDLFRADCESQSSPSDAARWVALLRDHPSFGGLYKAIDFSDLLVALNDITDICQRQLNSSFTKRLEVIIAKCIISWAVDDLLQFALTASSSLTHLQLANRVSTIKGHPIPQHQAIASFRDLQTIKAILQDHLPNLKVLWVNLGGVETAEEECQGMLDRCPVGHSGTIRDLQINTEWTLLRGFNVIRALSPLCSTGGKVRVGLAPTSASCIYKYPDEPLEKFDIVSVEQTKFLRFIQQQPMERKIPLSVVDFSSLDISTFPQVYAITYDSENRPQRRGFDAAARWLVDAMVRRARLTQTGRPLTSAQQWCLDAARRLVKLSPTSAIQEMMEEAMRMIGVSAAAERRGRGGQSGLDGIEDCTMGISLEMQDHILAMEYLAETKREAGIEGSED